jgi:hypothetical protein
MLDIYQRKGFVAGFKQKTWRNAVIGQSRVTKKVKIEGSGSSERRRARGFGVVARSYVYDNKVNDTFCFIRVLVVSSLAQRLQ